MTKFVSVVVCVAMGLVACSSDVEGSASSGAAGCSDISGNYSVAVERLSGTCDPALDSKTSSVGIQRSDDGGWIAIIPGISGGCPGTLDSSCKLNLACEIKDASGQVVQNLNGSYKFTSTGFTGTTLNGASPPTVPVRCDVTYRETGTKL